MEIDRYDLLWKEEGKKDMVVACTTLKSKGCHTHQPDSLLQISCMNDFNTFPTYNNPVSSEGKIHCSEEISTWHEHHLCACCYCCYISINTAHGFWGA